MKLIKNIKKVKTLTSKQLKTLKGGEDIIYPDVTAF